MKVTHFEKALRLEGATTYGYLKLYFGHHNSDKVLPRLSFEKFTALSHLLQFNEVFYNKDHKVFYTRPESGDVNAFLKEMEVL